MSLMKRVLKGLGCIGALFCLGLVSVVALGMIKESLWEWNLPPAIPLVLDFSTDMNVEDVMRTLQAKYSVEKDKISIRVIRWEYPNFGRRKPLRHQLVAEGFSAPGLTERKLECRFLKDRLMTVMFIPALTAEERKSLKGEFESWNPVAPAGSVREDWNWRKNGEVPVFDDFGWASLVFSKLMYQAYTDWLIEHW